MKKVYTRTGDKGTTGIHGGARVPKDDIRIEANGCLDELNAVIGIVRSMLSAGDDRQELLHTIQKELMVVMSHVATPDDVLNPNLLSAAGLTVRCEQEMDAMTAGLTENGYFLLPGRYARFGATAFCPHGGKACRKTLMDASPPISAE